MLRVRDNPQWNVHEFMHGSTCHGNQSLDENERLEPSAYYHRQGPLGRIFQALQPRRSAAEIGVLGLGAGTIAAYGQPGQRITFYEIDPAVERIARDPAILHLPGRFVARTWKSFWATLGFRSFVGRRGNSTCWWSTSSVPIRCPFI